MSTFLLEDFDKHIRNLRSVLSFLNTTLDATDHNAPDWLATDLISLRNKSGRLQDDVQRFRDQLESEGLGVKTQPNKRLSLESVEPKPHPKSTNSANLSISRETSSDPNPQPATPRHSCYPNDYVVQHIDVTEEVNRRLQENRLRRLMDSPSTSQKRKYNALVHSDAENGGEQSIGDEKARLLSELGSPTKRLRASEGFEDRLKRKENVAGGEWQGRVGERNGSKRRKKM